MAEVLHVSGLGGAQEDPALKKIGTAAAPDAGTPKLRATQGS